MTFFARLLLATALFSAGIYGQHDHSTPAAPEPEKSEKTELIDEFGSLGHCDLTARFDHLFMQLSEKPDSVGYVLVYQTTEALPADYDVPPMERMFRNHMAFRNFDASRVVVMNAGFRTDLRTQLWIVPPGGEIPAPSETVKAPVIPVDRTFLFDRSSVFFEDFEELTEFELPSVKAKREADQAAIEAELAAETEIVDAEPVAEEPQSETVVPEPRTEEERSENDQSEDSGEAETEYVDTRTPEEIEAARFHWVSEKFGPLLEKREDSSGVIILYADDQTLDIDRLMEFVEDGKWRLATSARINADRITVRFGGYRDYPAVDFWIVPSRGKAPVPTPDERPVEEPEDEEGSRPVN